MRKLRMVDKGPNRNYRRGQIIEVDDLRAVHLLSGGHAKDFDEPEEVIAEDGNTEHSEELQVLPRQV
jgi:hypothetical protein